MIKPIQQSNALSWRDRTLLGVVVLFFWQLWFDVGGVTLRLEDVLIVLLLAGTLLPMVFTFSWPYLGSALNRPIVAVCAALLIGIAVTWVRPFSGTIKKDALINGFRLIFMLCLYFYALQWHDSAENKTRKFLRTVIGFSFVTTAVCLLQVAHWAGALPVALPAQLTTFARGAARGVGKEIFGLYLGNTGTHVWSALLSMQLLTVWLLGRQQLQRRWRWGSFFYAGLLFLLLLRMSVRNSILGVLAALLFAAIFFSGQRQQRILLLGRAVVASVVLLMGLVVVAAYFPESPLVERVVETIPKYEDGRWIVSRRSNIFGRIEANFIALKLFARSPLVGSGFWGFYPLQVALRQSSDSLHAHNAFLQIMAELGLIGTLAWGWLFARMIHVVRTLRPHAEATVEHHVLWQLVVASGVFYLFTAFFAIPFFQTQQLGWLMVLMGLLMSFAPRLPRSLDADA